MNGQITTSIPSSDAQAPPMRTVRERIREVLSRELDPNERLMIVLRFAERMTYCEIGAVLRMTGEQVEAKIETLLGRLDTLV